jgi:hypothetical protein
LSSTGFASLFLGFLFNREEGGDMFLRNVIDFLRMARCYMTEDRTPHDRFLVYWTSLISCRGRMMEWFVNDELESVCKEVALSCF